MGYCPFGRSPKRVILSTLFGPVLYFTGTLRIRRIGPTELDRNAYLHHERANPVTRYNDRINRTNYGSGRDSPTYSRTILEPMERRSRWSVALVVLAALVGVVACLF